MQSCQSEQQADIHYQLGCHAMVQVETHAEDLVPGHACEQFYISLPTFRPQFDYGFKICLIVVFQFDRQEESQAKIEHCQRVHPAVCKENDGRSVRVEQKRDSEWDNADNVDLILQSTTIAIKSRVIHTL